MVSFSSFKAEDDPGRVAALHRYNVLGEVSTDEFKDIVSLVRSIFNMSFAAINLIDADRQRTMASAGGEFADCSRSDAFCNVTIETLGPLAISDTAADGRFRQSAFVTGVPHLRSYLGVPLTTPDGYNIGALCVFDTVPREFSAQDIDVLTNFGRIVVSQMELRLAAQRDGLTGVMSRSAFPERVQTFLDTAGHGDASLVLLDIDHFKSINDGFGHPAGDKVLRLVAECIAAQVRRDDCVGRMGGEEFAVFLPGATQGQALMLAERLRSSVAGLQIAILDDQPVTVSLGVAQARHGEDFATVFERADQALYHAKRSGRNRASVADDRKRGSDTH